MHRLQFTGTAPRHPSIRPSVHPSIISPLSSKHPKVIITPLRSNEKVFETKPTFDHHHLSELLPPRTELLVYSISFSFPRLFDAKAWKESHRIGYPNSNNNIYQYIGSRYFKHGWIRFKPRRNISMYNDLWICRSTVDRTIPRIVTNRSENDRFFFFLETIHARKKHIPILDILFKKEKCRYIIEIEFQSPSSNIRTKRKLEKRARVVPPEIGRGKNLFQSLRLFSNRKHWGRGERGKRIHQRGEWIATNDGSYFESNQSPYKLHMEYGEGGGTWRDNTGNAHWLKQAYLERNKFHDKLEGFRYDWPSNFSASVTCAAFAN